MGFVLSSASVISANNLWIVWVMNFYRFHQQLHLDNLRMWLMCRPSVFFLDVFSLSFYYWRNWLMLLQVNSVGVLISLCNEATHCLEDSYTWAITTLLLISKNPLSNVVSSEFTKVSSLNNLCLFHTSLANCHSPLKVFPTKTAATSL